MAPPILLLRPHLMQRPLQRPHVFVHWPARTKKPTGQQSGIEATHWQTAVGFHTIRSIQEPSSASSCCPDTTGWTHTICLSKDPAIPLHFLLVTVVHDEQTDRLEGTDISVTYIFLKERGKNTSDKRLFPFYNSEAHSDTGQRHRHIVILPIERTQSDDSERIKKPLISEVDGHASNGIPL